MRRLMTLVLIATCILPPQAFAQESDSSKRYAVAPGQPPDIAAIQKAVTAIGVRKKVEVTTSGQKLRATILSVEDTSFTVLAGSRLMRRRIIEYSTVTAVKPASRRLVAKWLVGVGIGLGVGMLIFSQLPIFAFQSSLPDDLNAE